MSKHHFKSNVIFSQPALNANRETGLLKNIVIAQHGENKNGSYFNDQFLEDLVQKGNEQSQGVKCRFGHPNMCATSLGTFLGRYKNFRIQDKKVYADLTLDPISKKTHVEGKGITMWDYVFDMAENNPDMFGNSIVVSANIYEEVVDDKAYESLELIGFVASDLVDDPAATDSLFSNSNDLGILATEFLDNNPEVFEAIENDPTIIEDFFSRYENYLNNYKSMSFLSKLRKKFGNDTFDVEETTATGDIVTVITDDQQPKVGDAVVDANGNPVEDGDLTLKDETIWVIVDGLISEIKEPESGEDNGNDEATQVSELSRKIDKLIQSFDKFKTNYSKDLKENQEAFELIADEVGKFSKKHEALAKTVTSKKFEKLHGEDSRKTKESKGFDVDRARELREQRKKR